MNEAKTSNQVPAQFCTIRTGREIRKKHESLLTPQIIQQTSCSEIMF